VIIIYEFVASPIIDNIKIGEFLRLKQIERDMLYEGYFSDYLHLLTLVKMHVINLEHNAIGTITSPKKSTSLLFLAKFLGVIPSSITFPLPCRV